MCWICRWLNTESKTIISIIFYRILLDVSYYEIITPSYSYTGLKNNMTEETMILSWMIICVSLWFMNFLMNDINVQRSRVIMSFIYYISFVPLTTCISAGIISEECTFWSMAYYLELFLMYALISKTKQIQLDFVKPDVGRIIVYIILGVCVCSIIYISYQYTGLRMNFNLDRVYELRSEVGKYRIHVLLNYVYSMSRTLIPFLLGYFLLKKKILFCGLLFFVQCLSFGIDGSKSAFFMTFCAMFIIMMYKRLARENRKYFPFLFVFSIVVCGLLENIILNSYEIDSRIVRRIMFDPPYLHQVYFDFFSINEPDYLREGVLRHFGFVSPYISFGGVSRAIGAFLGKPNMGANNGLFSDAIVTGGSWGILILPILIVLVLYLFDACTVGLPEELIVVAALQVSISLISSSLGTILLSHGLLLILFCAAIIGKKMRSG